jgi:hypothetical protein
MIDRTSIAARRGYAVVISLMIAVDIDLGERDYVCG